MRPQAFISKVNNFFRENKPLSFSVSVKWDVDESNVKEQGQQQTIAQPATRRCKVLRGTPGEVIIHFWEEVMHAITASVRHAS